MLDTLANPTPPAIPAIPRLVAEAISELDSQRDNLLAVIPHALVVEQIVADWADRFAQIKAHVSGIGGDVWINVWMRSMDEVIALRRHMAAIGYHLRGKVQDYPDDRRQVHVLGCADMFGEIVLNVRAAQDEGATCRYVEVGTKVVPVYRLECSEVAQ